MANESTGLLHACLLDGNGGATDLDWDGVRAHWNDESFVWVHLDYSVPAVQEWMNKESGLDPVACAALTSTDTRPRSVPVGDGLLVNLRGVNLNPGADPEDMISFRFWIEHNCLITLRQRRSMVVEDVQEALRAGRGPKKAFELLLSLAEGLVSKAGLVIDGLADESDELEDAVIAHESRELRSRIAAVRRTAIGIRRYLAPQRDAMSRLVLEQVSWISDSDRIRLRELTDRVTRFVEELDAVRDRASVTQEELASRLAEQANRTMYVLAVVTGVFLPLGLLTGLLGINVGGMPGTESKAAFWVVCGLLVVIAIGEWFVLRKRKWL